MKLPPPSLCCRFCYAAPHNAPHYVLGDASICFDCVDLAIEHFSSVETIEAEEAIKQRVMRGRGE